MGNLHKPSGRRTLPVRLTDISLAVRCAAARSLVRQGEDGLEMLAAAVDPSSRVYFVAGSAGPMLERLAA